jgi:hypothetical protein
MNFSSNIAARAALTNVASKIGGDAFSRAMNDRVKKS